MLDVQKNERIEKAFSEWKRLQVARYNEVLYGVALTKDGDQVYALRGAGQIDRIVFAGYGSLGAESLDHDQIEAAMAEDRFQIVARRRGEEKFLRLFPLVEGNPNWSRKSAHPDIGGLGMISAVLLPN